MASSNITSHPENPVNYKKTDTLRPPLKTLSPSQNYSLTFNFSSDSINCSYLFLFIQNNWVIKIRKQITTFCSVPLFPPPTFKSGLTVKFWFKSKTTFTLMRTHLLANSPPGGRFGMLSVANVRITWTKSGTPSPCFFMISGNQKYFFCKCSPNLT